MELGCRFLLLWCVVAASVLGIGHSRRLGDRKCITCVIDYRRISTVFDAKFRKVSKDLEKDYSRRLNETKIELTETFIGFGVDQEPLPEIGLLEDSPDHGEVILDTKNEISDLSGMVIDLQLEFDEFKDSVIEFKEEKRKEISTLEIQNSEMKESITMLQSTNELLNRTMHTLVENALSEITSLVEQNSEKIALLQAESAEAKEEAQKKIEMQQNQMDSFLSTISALRSENVEINESLRSMSASSQEEIASLKKALEALKHSNEENSSEEVLNSSKIIEEGEEFDALNKEVIKMNETLKSMKSQNEEIKEALRSLGERPASSAVESLPEKPMNQDIPNYAAENATGMNKTIGVAPTSAVVAIDDVIEKVSEMTTDITELREQMEYMSLTVDAAVKVRLVGGNSKAGRVEVFYKGVWGTICDDYWDRSDGTVVCRMLGFHHATSVFVGAAYGQGKGQIWLDDLECDGGEDTLWDCSGRSWGSENCEHSEDASVVCV